MSLVRHVVIADPDTGERQRITGLVESAASELELPVVMHEAADGAQALTMIDRHHPPLVIAEILLPEVSGLSLLRRVRDLYEKSAQPLFILVTAMGRESDRYWGLRNGAHAYVIKPYEDEVLLARIRQVLQAGKSAQPEKLGPI